MNAVFASVTSETAMVDGADYSGGFKSIWVGGSGDIAVSRDKGLTNVVYTNVPTGFFTVKGDFIVGASTTATGLLACSWT